jgi:hypothetical protein
MLFLPVSSALVVTGGRNDDLCKVNKTPMLNDLHMFLLDQKVWINIKYSDSSKRLGYICNASATVVTDGYNFEKIILFGGV